MPSGRPQLANFALVGLELCLRACARAAMATLFDAQRCADRSVGVVACEDGVAPGYVLLSVAKMVYLLDSDGRVAHSWTSKRTVFVAYLLKGGDLLRDGNELALAPQFKAGGAAGYIECVTWDNEPVWSWSALPRFKYLSHHDLQPLPNGNVLVLVWERKTKEEAVAAGRHPELIPDGEVWNNLVVEIQPDGTGKASEVWRWSQWDHLCQAHDPSKDNYVKDISAHWDRLDINYCPPGGKAKCRGGGLKAGDHNATALAVFDSVGKTGERDWIHANAVSYSRKDSGLVVVSYNVPCEVIILAHRAPRPGQWKGILYRFGNPLVSQRPPDRHLQTLFVQHSTAVCDDDEDPKVLRFVLFNNGRAPDRMWSTVDEYAIDMASSQSSKTWTHEKTWSFGRPAGHLGSFYSHHSSGVRKLENGNVLVTLGPQGILFEVTREGKEVWRYISPVKTPPSEDEPHSIVAQGAQRGAGKFGLFFADKYSAARVPKLGELEEGSGRRLEGPDEVDHRSTADKSVETRGRPAARAAQPAQPQLRHLDGSLQRAARKS